MSNQSISHFSYRLSVAALSSALCTGVSLAQDAKPQVDAQAEQIRQLKSEAELRSEKLAAELSTMRAENERLRVENELAAQKQAAALQQVLLEKARLEADLALLAAKDSTATAPERAKLEALQRAARLREAELSDSMAKLSAEQAIVKQGLEFQAMQLQKELAASRAEMERTRVADEVLDVKLRSKLAALKREQEQIAAENALAAEKRRAEQSRLLDEQARAAAVVQTTGAQIQYRDLEDKWRDGVNKPIEYTDQPFKDGILTVSDRRIDLNGPIVSGTADYVCDRIDYFNNQDRTKPIFVVIANSPGGSVMQGYRIVKAIETSDAPVHVLVKSFAASMAATIATLAPHSYAFPNAIILHHQMSTSASGNMTNLEEEVATAREWEKRLAEPIAKKMGLSLEAFKAKMYAAKKSGDWDEFADRALELKWIDHIVNEVREESIRRRPTDTNSGGWWMSALKRDEQGKPYFALPPLEPYDCYFMVNPRGFYRIDGR